MPYCQRLLQAEIFPQKLSRRPPIIILRVSSGYAWISTGRSSPAKRSVLAMARSSPKFGSVTMIPSRSSRRLLNRSAQRRASASVSTAPNFVWSGVRHTVLYPCSASTRNTSSRPSRASTSGKKPRLPTITPKVVVLMRTPLFFLLGLRLPVGGMIAVVPLANFLGRQRFGIAQQQRQVAGPGDVFQHHCRFERRARRGAEREHPMLAEQHCRG